MTIFVTGGAGFIGANFVQYFLANNHNEQLINIDKLTYAGNLDSLKMLGDNKNHIFIQADIGDKATIKNALQVHKPRLIINFAAESHVDRSIKNHDNFIQTNIVGLTNLLGVSLDYWEGLSNIDRENFRFIHVSTDEVYGDLSPSCPAFDEKSRYQPNNPYSASKAAGDHIARAYYKTYNFPVLISNCSNNYGPYQFPEKLIPLIIYNALRLKPLPIYGDGENRRDWLYVRDHCEALQTIANHGKIGENYNIGGNNEISNIQLVRHICDILDDICPPKQTMNEKENTVKINSYKQLITFVKDRLGHDRRYAINADKMAKDLDWRAKMPFQKGLRDTVQWYLQNNEWVENVISKGYQKDAKNKNNF